MSGTTEAFVTTALNGYELLADPQLNKGTAFSETEREAFDLHGLLPPNVSTLDEQVSRRLQALRSFETGLAQRNQVRQELLQDKNVEGRALGHYVRGEGYLGERNEEHQKRLDIHPLVEIEPAPVWSAPAPLRPGFWRRMFGVRGS